jgi:hypothetical protein
MKFLKTIFFTLVFISIFSCEESTNKNFTVNGKVKGLTKGTIYLEKVIDTIIQPIDSFLVKDNGQFHLGDQLESSEIYYLRIKEASDESLLIFGEKGIINVQSKLDKFATSAVITGSKNHDLLVEYKKMAQKFNDMRLDLFKANLEAEQAQDQKLLDSLNRIYKSLIRRRYLYTANFSVNHSDKEVAPYLALTELYNANISLLDTINNSLTSDIQDSKYGKQLDRFITVVKKNEAIK